MGTIFLTCGLFIVLAQWLFFIPAYLLKTEKFYDTIGSLSFIAATLLVLVLVETITPLAIAAALLVNLWALRLGSFLFCRVHQRNGDSRFDKLKNNPKAFFLAWNLQALWVFISLAPSLLLITAQSADVNWLNAVGLGLALVGLGYETIADEQKRRFKASRSAPFMRTGLWAYSQHPNYFGEIVFWSGLALAATPVMSNWTYLFWLSPMFIVILLSKVSGIPMARARAEAKHSDNPAWQEYIKRTPLLIPRPKAKRG